MSPAIVRKPEAVSRTKTARRGLEDWLRGRPPLTLWGETARLFLAPFAFLYRAVLALRAALYRLRWLPSRRLSRPTIAIGNLSVGGTGKTPCVGWLARALGAEGELPLILGRGYGAQSDLPGLDEEGASLLLSCTGVCVRQGRDRALAFQAAIAENPAISCVILDDGAQHLRLERDLDVWLLDARQPFERGFTLPAGGLREGPEALGRADVCVLTRVGRASAEELRRGEQSVRKWLRPDALLLFADHRPLAVRDEARREVSALGLPVFLIAGIADPQSFAQAAEQMGAQVVGASFFSDHHRFTRSELLGVMQAAREAGAKALLMTTKDAPKLRPLAATEALIPLLELEIGFEFLDEGAAKLLSRVRTVLFSAREARP